MQNGLCLKKIKGKMKLFYQF